VVDMDHDDSTALLGRLGEASRLTRRVTPALALTRRGDLKTKLRALDLGVDDILTAAGDEVARHRSGKLAPRRTAEAGWGRPPLPCHSGRGLASSA
jgi:hypothetical protein